MLRSTGPHSKPVGRLKRRVTPRQALPAPAEADFLRVEHALFEPTALRLPDQPRDWKKVTLPFVPKARHGYNKDLKQLFYIRPPGNYENAEGGWDHQLRLRITGDVRWLDTRPFCLSDGSCVCGGAAEGRRCTQSRR